MLAAGRNRTGYTYIFFTSDNGFHQGQHRLSATADTARDIESVDVSCRPLLKPSLTH